MESLSESTLLTTSSKYAKNPNHIELINNNEEDMSDTNLNTEMTFENTIDPVR